MLSVLTLCNLIFVKRVHAVVDPASLSSASSIVSIVDMVGAALNILVLSAGAIFIGYLIFGAYKFATAQGDPKGIAGAKQSLTHSVIGLCIVIGVFAINSIVVGILGVSNSGLGTPDGILDSLRTGISEIVSWIDNTTPEPGDPLDNSAYRACVGGCEVTYATCVVNCAGYAPCINGGCVPDLAACKNQCAIENP